MVAVDLQCHFPDSALESGSGILFFLNFFGSRILIDEVRREAGGNPALPRNCKRGNSQPVTGQLGRPVAFIGQ
jgi:hypothetical protein